MAEAGNGTTAGMDFAQQRPPMCWCKTTVRGALQTGVKNHTATLVGSKLLIFGGFDGQKNHNDLFELDCTTYMLRKISNVSGDIPAGRNGHTATLAGGQLWVIGGWLGSGPLAARDMHVLDIKMMHWTRSEVYGDDPGPCNMHTTEYIEHLNELFVFRGGDGRAYLNDLHAFDIGRMVWREVIVQGRLPIPRANHGSAVIGRNMFIFGGWDGQTRLNDIHVLDTNTMTWSTPPSAGKAPEARAGMSFTNIRGKIFLFGGSGPQGKSYNDLRVYDPEQGKWLETAIVEDPEDVTKGGSVAGGDDQIQWRKARARKMQEDAVREPPRIFRGAYGEGNPNAEPESADITVVGTGPSARAGHSATLVGRKLIIFGGSDTSNSNQYLNDFHELDTDPPPAVVVSQVNSTTRFQQSLSKFLNDKTFSDVTFIVEGRPIYAHRVVLSLMTDRFRGMFESGFRETKEREIMIDHISYNTFYLMMEYLYTGNPPNLVLVTGKTQDEILQGKEAAGLYNTRPLNVLDEDEDEVDSDSDSDFDEDIMNEDEEANGDADFLDKTGMVDAQRGALSDMKFNDSNINTVAELICVADEFMLDHLKQACERALGEAINDETLDALIQVAERSSAQQLLAACDHYKRNYGKN